MIKKLLNSFEKNNSEAYVSWKNNHELDLVLDGESDLDIYVPHHYKKAFFSIAKKEGWIQSINPVADYPEIYHFHTVDKDLKHYHLHVYFKIITGESWLKEYDFPIGDYLIHNRKKHVSGIYILNQKAQAFLFVLRHFIKGCSFFSRKLYRKELDSYQNEWSLCKASFNPKVNTSLIDFSPYMSSAHLGDNFNTPNKNSAQKVRNQLSSYLRVSKSKLNLLRLSHLWSRAVNKLILKRKKILPQTGFILAFSGADGVGKSTMSETIGAAYSKFLTVKKVQLGKPQSRIVEKLRKIINRNSEVSTSTKIKTINKNKPMSLKKAVSATVLAYLRFKESKKAIAYKHKGYLVISDRWPTSEIGKMDGPQLKIEDLKGLKRQLAIIESYYYTKIPQSDLCIVLTVPIEIAVQRNRDRIKAGKETDEEIVMRHKENASHQPISHMTIHFNNNGALVEKRFELIQIIQQHINKNNV